MIKILKKIKKTLIHKTKNIVNLETGKAGGRDANHILIATHGSNFHPDDVCATAAALLYYGVDKTGLGKFLHGFNELQEKHNGEFVRVVRTLDKKVMDKATVLMDIGREYDEKRKRFDHHQEGGAGKREDGTPYASFGLVWKKFGKKIVGNADVAEYVDKMFVKQIDAMDNGISIAKSMFADGTSPLLFEDIIRLDCDLVFGLNLEPQEMNKVFDKTFFKLVPLAQKMIIMTALKGYAIVEADKKLEQLYNKAVDKRVIIMDKKTPVKLSNFKEPLFMVYPSLRGGWNAQAVRIGSGSYESRTHFPKSWEAKDPADLQKITGVPDATFCASGRWLVAAGSKAGVLKLVDLALKEIEAGREKVKIEFDQE
ncbi:MAG: MYG1 family protein [bacterium]